MVRAMPAPRSRTAAAFFVASLLMAGCSRTSAGSASPIPSPSRSPDVSSASPASPTPDPAAGSQPVRFEASGGVQLAGRLFGDGPVGVVLAHQVDDDQSDWFPYAQRLAARGYWVLTFDLRGYCPGGDAGCSSGSPDVASSAEDVAAAAHFLSERGAKTLVLIGASVGGQAVLVHAARDPDGVAGVISLSAPVYFAYDITAKTLAGLDVPTLFIAGRGDGDAATSARSFARWVGGSTDLLVLDTGEHGVDLLSEDEPSVARIVDRRILAFLRRAGNG
jgi:pimeloyl-ACP methyl ester carboxylesterase